MAMSYFTLSTEGLSWDRGPSKDDVSPSPADNAWNLAPASEKEKGLAPLGREFLAYMRAHKSEFNFEWQSGNWPHFSDGASNYAYTALWSKSPGFRALVLKKLDWILKKDAEFSSAQHVELTCMLLPYRNFMGLGELDGGGLDWTDQTISAVANQPLTDLAAQHGIEVCDLFPIIRLMSPMYFPMYAFGDAHLMAHSHEQFGWAMAQVYLAGRAASDK
jgi:hypothetical protein